MCLVAHADVLEHDVAHATSPRRIRLDAEAVADRAVHAVCCQIGDKDAFGAGTCLGSDRHAVAVIEMVVGIDLVDAGRFAPGLDRDIVVARADPAVGEKDA